MSADERTSGGSPVIAKPPTRQCADMTGRDTARRGQPGMWPSPSPDDGCSPRIRRVRIGLYRQPRWVWRPVQAPIRSVNARYCIRGSFRGGL